MKVIIANFKKTVYTLLLICCVASYANAQEFRFTAAVNANTIGTDELVRIQFMIENPQNLSSFNPPEFKGFEVVQGPQQMQGTSIINGRASTYYAFSYVLQPKQVGSFTIPAASARVDGRIVKSNPVNIEVVKGGAGTQMPQQQPQQPPRRAFPDRGESQPGVLRQGEDVKEKLRRNIFVKVDVDKTTVYEGEQLTATYKLYTRLPTNSSVTKVPAFKGFSAKDIDLPNPPQATEEMVNGVPFKVFIIRKTLLFPLQSGQLELDPAEVDNQVHLVSVNRKKRAGNDPFNDPFFRDAFGGSNPFDDPFFEDAFASPQYEVVPYKIQSPTVKITVKPLPAEGRPASFSGAVGNFKMTAAVDKAELSTDDAITLKVNITGQGNVNLLNAPPLNIPSAFEKYDPSVSDNIDKNSNPLSGTRQFQYVLMPQEKGDFTLPPVEFSYFDPVAKAYKTLQSASFPLHVIAGKLAKKEKEDFGSTELADIRTSGQHWSKRSPFFFGKPLFWALLILPLLALGGMAAYYRRRQFRQSNVALLRHKHANKVALKRLELAARYLKEGKDKAFYEETSRAVWGYLSHKLKIPMAELNKQVVQEKLQQLQINGTTGLQLSELIDRCEMALYAPVSSNEHRQGAYQEAVQVISSLEDELKGRSAK